MFQTDFDANDRMDKALARTKALVNQLTYDSYYHNRRLHPNVPLSEWAKIFQDVDSLEERYQDDLYADSIEFQYKHKD